MAEEVRAAAAPEPHFLVVTYPAQGHINPARHLARRLLRATGARVTISTAMSAFHKMFQGKEAEADGEGHRDAAGVWYVPYSDGYDAGFDRAVHDHTHYMTQVKVVGSRTLAGVLGRLRDAGRPVTLVVYTLLLSWVADVARDHGVPAALYWIQPATVLAAYLHFFRGTDGVDKAIAAAGGDPWATVRVPGLSAPLRIRDLPSFITATSENDPYAFVADAFRELIDMLGRDDSPSVLANTFDAMEPEAVASLREHGVDVVPVGPVLSFLDDAPAAGAKNGSNDLFKQDGNGYLEWLDAQAPGSVVYISFGSLSVMSKRQIEEVARGISESGRPFLWVLREDNRSSEGADAASLGGERGMVVEWCDQVWVLSHPAVGCFVTHCGWNSTLESVACGVPVVGVPQWTDQGTNAWLVERLGTGVRAAVSDKDGVLEADELRRCLDFATSEMVRAKATVWRENARAAASEGGSSERNLRAFVGKQLAGGN
ncbi:Crocetin glucosyltransferase, chloroplastic [Dichanthelium oligosanthes]|uniref:Glycosyltransferase n=1 Tax=Dichanthelium oligosanthes TaxID=888268 RepID=A0A1E5WA61_9POAL|nr:Crocetin glucosyltransferase, chloroplastic [Dichanthelium oligosanthes]